VRVVAGEDLPAGVDQERHVGVHKVRGAARPEKFAHFLSCQLVEHCDVKAGQGAGQVGLAAALAPDLRYGTSTRPYGFGFALEDPQHRPDSSVAPVDGDQGAGVEHGGHAAPRCALLSTAAAASSSESLKGPSSASHASKAAPSSSLRRRRPAAAASQLETLGPCRAAESRTAAPISGGIVTERRSTCAMHTSVTHTMVCNGHQEAVGLLGPEHPIRRASTLRAGWSTDQRGVHSVLGRHCNSGAVQ